MANATWKRHERRVAQALGGRRLGATGRENPDVDAGWLQIECKHRARLPGWIGQALAKVRGQAGPGRLGIVVAHELRGRDSWVILSLKDFQEWFGGDALADGERPESDGE